MTFIDMDDWDDRNRGAEAGVDYVKTYHPIVEFHRDTDFNPSSDLLLRADNRTGICSPGWIHKPRLHSPPHASLAGRGNNEGINNDDMRPKRWTKRQIETTASWLARTTAGWLAYIVIYHMGYHRYIILLDLLIRLAHLMHVHCQFPINHPSNISNCRPEQ